MMTKRTLAVQWRSACGQIGRYVGCAAVVMLAQVINSPELDASQLDSELEKELRSVISTHGLTGDPAAGVDVPKIDSPKVRLGRDLFFSKNLSGNRDTACASCHHPRLGGGDALSLSIGSQAHIPDLLGPGRTPSADQDNFDGGPNVPRNAPTTFNIALWKRILFHDGRIERTEEGIRSPLVPVGNPDPNARRDLVGTQAMFPVTSASEMSGNVYDAGLGFGGIYKEIADRLRYVPIEREVHKVIDTGPGPWLKHFQQAFDDAGTDPASVITYPRIADALAAYQKSQIFVDTPWNRWVKGDSVAIDDDAKRGAMLFFNGTRNGGASCASCHTGDRFTDEKFHTVAMPQIGRGKHVKTSRTRTDDLGRYHSTLKSEDRHKFRTPMLLNVAVTGPWSHSGAYTRLEDVIRHHLDPVGAVRGYDASVLAAGVQSHDQRKNALTAIESFERDWPENSWPGAGAKLSDTDIGYLVKFLNTLTDPCTQNAECLKPWLPDRSGDFPDDHPLIAVDADGEPL